MVLRHVANEITPVLAPRPLRTAGALALLAVAAVALRAPAAETEGANVRIATFAPAEDATGDRYFAASIQPSADDALVTAVRDASADVVIVIDTSASQVGAYRDDSMTAAREVIKGLRDGDRVRIFAADVTASDLSGAFHPGDASATSAGLAKLDGRLPLGHTNLTAVLDEVRAGLVGGPDRRTRSIVYIGDGASIQSTQDRGRFEGLVDALRSDRISVHSLAIGPGTNLEVMGILANQTGGVVGVAGQGEQASAGKVASEVARSAVMSPIWLSDARLPSGMNTIQSGRLPPLRLDRDTILIGSVASDTEAGRLTLTGETPVANVKITSDADVESSHPDFSFLPGLVNETSGDGGLLLPSAGSGLLRQTGRMMAARAEGLARAGELALSQGNDRGAQAIAEEALQADPLHPRARAIREASGGDGRLIMQNQGEAGNNEPFQAADQADDGTQDGDQPQNGGADQAAAPASAAGDQAAADNQSGQGSPAPAPAAPQADAGPSVFGAGPAGDEDLLEGGGELLDRVEEFRRAAAGRLRAEVRAQLREARRRMRINPVGLAGQLKTLLARVEGAANISEELRRELAGQVRAAIQVASRREADYGEAQATAQQVAAGATAKARLLEETFRREARLEALSQQLNALIDEGRYAEADGEVSLEFARIAGDTFTEDSVEGRQFTDFPLALQVFDRDQRYREMRERNFVDAFSLVLKSNIPFVDEPPVVYPDAEVWRRLSRRRMERYGSAIELTGDNRNEQQIQSALDNEVSLTFLEEPLESAVARIQDQARIPIVIDQRALDELGLQPDIPVTIDLENVSLRSFLRLMLREYDLTYMIKDEVLQITTTDAAGDNLVNKVYPVGDLVVPIIQMGGMGGMGGGMMGGMGGGMGGMGGGMGGGRRHGWHGRRHGWHGRRHGWHGRRHGRHGWRRLCRSR